MSQALHDFAFKMLQYTLRNSGEEENVLLSPISMYNALSALLPGKFVRHHVLARLKKL